MKENKFKVNSRWNSRLNKSAEGINELEGILRNYLISSGEKRRCIMWMRGERYIG